MKKHVSAVVFLFVAFILFFVYVNIAKINNNIAVSEFSRGNFDSALSNFKRAVGFQNREQITKYNLANTNSKIYDHDEARKLYNELLSKENLSPQLKSEIYFNLGNIECMYENFDKALEYYYMALTLNSEDEDIRFNIELVEYINRPIIYNDEILLFPRQKIEEQISLLDKTLVFKNKINNELSTVLDSNYKDYYSIESKGTDSYRQIKEIMSSKIAKTKKSFSELKKSAANKIKDLKHTQKNYDVQIDNIKRLMAQTGTFINEYETLKHDIMKKLLSPSCISKKELSKILSNTMYKDENNQTDTLIAKYDPSSEDNLEKDISVEVRDVFHVMDQLQYLEFTKNYSEILKNFETALKNMEEDFGITRQISAYQIAGLKKIISDICNDDISRDMAYYDKYMSFINNINRDILNSYGIDSLDKYMRKIKDNKSYLISYEKTLSLLSGLSVLNSQVMNIQLLLTNIADRIILYKNFLQQVNDLLAGNVCFADQSSKAFCDSVKTMLADIQELVDGLQNSKQIYNNIGVKNTAYIGLLFKVLSNKYYFNTISSGTDRYEELKKYFVKQKEIFEDKEQSAAKKKEKMKIVNDEIKEFENEILSVNKNKHMYVNLAEAENTIKNKENIKKDELKKYELELIKEVKTFIYNFLGTITSEMNQFKSNLSVWEKLLKSTLSLNEAEQKNGRNEFLMEKGDLEFDLANFELAKKYYDQDKITAENLQADNIISKTIYQREKLDRLLSNEQIISKQIEDLKISKDNILKMEKEELASLEKDLVEKQLALVKYYVTVEDDTTKKTLTRDIMKSLYKGKYKTDKTDDFFSFDFESYSNFKDAILQLYKMSVVQVRELNKLIFRIKVINAILELEYTTKLKQRIDFDKQNLKGRNLSELNKELYGSNDFINKNKKSENKEIIKIFKENLESADQLKKRLVDFHEKQYNAQRQHLKDKMSNAERKIKILNNKIDALSEHVKYNTYELNSKEDIAKMKEEIKIAKEEQKKLAQYKVKVQKDINNIKKEVNVDEIMFGVMQSSDLILDQIDKNGERNKDVISKSDRDRIMNMQSGKEQSVKQKKTAYKNVVENDW